MNPLFLNFLFFEPSFLGVCFEPFVWRGVSFFDFLNSFCFKFLCFEAPFLGENPLFLNPFF
ncbi:hypothetical protein HPY228_01605 [Helicobacter pylori]|nr:hypothetical protein HPY228_01605 [Helicobacter pylori]